MAEPTYELFAPLVDAVFTARHPNGAEAELRLERVEDLSEKMRLPAHLRRPFALYLRAPESVDWDQGTLEIEHPDTGTHTLFCVPIVHGTLDPGRLFQVVFA
ncbi:MAG: hypothetical protein QNJ98_10125 [Planctomycetota bacterium]|nr:hypothetical protein [Planctomycetota bacterium]